DAYMRKFDHIEDIHRRIFAAMLANLDDSVGAITARLRKRGLDENTLVFFLSDNGGPTRELTSSNAPLRGEKGQVYEGGIRVPFILRWQGHLPAGTVKARPISATDIFPTSLAAAGVPLPKNTPRDGTNLLPYLMRSKAGWPARPLYWRQGAKTAVRVGDWKLLRHGRRGRPGPWQLYNLARDLAEANDLAAERPDKLEELRGIWTRLDKEMVEAKFR
ncbi:MAG: sulfatase-like hydrolase/transferase, partial [Phycisphaerae bacterium]|nr:sulfatase-like hydrolase/transferase [Phycisphaerae bacterium]